MKPFTTLPILTAAITFTVFVALGCITINVHFPTKELEEAAEQFVDDVRPEQEGGDPGDEPVAPVGEQETSSWWSTALGVNVAYAQTKSDLNVSTPKIAAIKKTLKARYPKLFPSYKGLVIGDGNDGYLSVRDDSKLNLKAKRDLKALVAAENKDRKELYGEIAVANKIDKKNVGSIGKLFSVQWQKKSKPGWWIQDAKGKWQKKPQPKP